MADQTPAPVTTDATLAEETQDYQAYKASRLPLQTVPGAEPAAEPAPVEEAKPAEVKPPAEEPKADAETDEDAEEAKPRDPDTRTPTEKRIAKAVRAQREAERREVAAREEAARLKGRLEAIEAAQPKPQAQEPPTKRWGK